MKALLLSIKPEYVERILCGDKKFEYRKRLAREKADLIFIYSTAPEMKVVASVEVLGSVSTSPTALWEQTKNFAGISRTKYREYFHGCKTAHAYKLGSVKVFDKAKVLSEFGINVAPQSFVYIETEGPG